MPPAKYLGTDAHVCLGFVSLTISWVGNSCLHFPRSLPLDKFELLHLVPGEPPPKWAPAHGAVVACAAAHAPDGICAAEGSDVVFATMLKWADGGECSVKFGNAKVKMVPSSAISQAPDGSAVTAPAADDKAAGPATAAAAKGGKKKAAKKKKGGGKKKAKKKN